MEEKIEKISQEGENGEVGTHPLDMFGEVIIKVFVSMFTKSWEMDSKRSQIQIWVQALVKSGYALCALTMKAYNQAKYDDHIKE